MIRNTIIQAIHNRQVIEFTYKGFTRIVEPFLLGTTTTGKVALRGYQIGGGSSSGRIVNWHLFTLANMENLRITDSTFSGSRPGYNPADSAMVAIYARI